MAHSQRPAHSGYLRPSYCEVRGESVPTPSPRDGVPISRPLPVGKLHPDLLARLLHFQGWPDPRVALGPRIGEDAAAINFGDRYLIP